MVLDRFSIKEVTIGRKQNTFAKIQRDRIKKQKAEDKRIRRLERKNEKAEASSESDSEQPDGDEGSTDEDSIDDGSVDEGSPEDRLTEDSLTSEGKSAD